jgi:transposase InsO family protein
VRPSTPSPAKRSASAISAADHTDPQTNGKAERFIRTLINGSAYAAIYGSSRERTAALDGWLWHDNHRRRHSALGHQPPVSRTNLLGSYI